MKVVAYKGFDGSIFLDDFCNDNDAIDLVLEQSGRKEEVNGLYDSLSRDNAFSKLPVEEFDRRWNEYVMKTIEILAENGCEIVWSD